MDILQFIASLVKSLAWPIVVLMGLLLFSRPIAQRIHAIRGLSYKDAKISFEEVAKEVRASLAVETIERGAMSKSPISKKIEWSNLNRLVFIWSQLIGEVRGRVASRGHETARMNDERLIEFALDNQILTPEQGKALNGLRTMRNLAVHSPRAELDDAKYTQFCVLAESMAYVLELEIPPLDDRSHSSAT
jgi:hypothetical protein